MRGHQIENELTSLSPNSFESLQLYFSKFKALVLQLKQCGIEKKDDQLVLAILSKLGPDYSVFVSTFYDTKLTARTWKMPSLADFMKSLTQEQDKLVMMGTIKPSRDQAMVSRDSRWIQKARRNLKIHLSKRETRTSLQRSLKVPRRTPRRRRTKEK